MDSDFWCVLKAKLATLAEFRGVLYASGFPCLELQGRMELFWAYVAIGRYGPVSDFLCVLKAKLAILAEFRGVLYADHISCHPYIERLPTL